MAFFSILRASLPLVGLVGDVWYTTDSCEVFIGTDFGMRLMSHRNMVFIDQPGLFVGPAGPEGPAGAVGAAGPVGPAGGLVSPTDLGIF